MRPNQMKTERRRGPRDEVSASLAILCTNGEGQETRLQAHLVDISVKGARMRVPQKLPRNTTVYFYHDKLRIGGRGSIRYCNLHKQGYEVGVEFPSGTGWKPLKDADLSALAAKVNDAKVNDAKVNDMDAAIESTRT